MPSRHYDKTAGVGRLLAKATLGTAKGVDRLALGVVGTAWGGAKGVSRLLRPSKSVLGRNGTLLTLGTLAAVPIAASALLPAPKGISRSLTSIYNKGRNSMYKISSVKMTGSLLPRTKVAGAGAGGKLLASLVKEISPLLKVVREHPFASAATGIGGLGALAAYEIGDAPIDTSSYLLGKKIFPSLTTRVKADETFASEFFKTLGKDTADTAMGALTSGAQQGATAIQRAMNGRTRVNIVDALIKSDDIISQAPPGAVDSAMSTLAKFAPTLSTDPNAVRSYLREAVTYGSGPDYATISNLANTESRLQEVGLPNFGPIGRR